jgi:hypothetical protein
MFLIKKTLSILRAEVAVMEKWRFLYRAQKGQSRKMGQSDSKNEEKLVPLGMYRGEYLDLTGKK